MIPTTPSPDSGALSHYFSLADLCRSETARAEGIDNTPPAELIPNLRRLALGLDQVRNLLEHALEVSSGYRCPALNARVGGVPNSQHTLGMAADFCAPAFGEPLMIAAAICRSSIVFDQLILEFGRWVHISFTPAPRRRALTLYSSTQGFLEGVWTRDGERLV